MVRENTPTKVTEAIVALDGDPRFAVVVSWLRGELETTRKENDFLDGIKLTRNQGCAITLDRILKDFEREGGSRKGGNTDYAY